MCSVMPNMPQVCFWPGLYPRLCWGSLWHFHRLFVEGVPPTISFSLDACSVLLWHLWCFTL